MGTNFYVAGARNSDDPVVHIGKRSAAGLYCWDCRVTLCRDGEAAIHFEHSGFFSACPRCGAEPVRESLSESSAGQELGFNRSEPSLKRGVRSCSSFSWAMQPDRLEGIEAIEDEYGRYYTRAEFLVVLEECPVRFIHSIGRWFS